MIPWKSDLADLFVAIDISAFVERIGLNGGRSIDRLGSLAPAPVLRILMPGEIEHRKDRRTGGRVYDRRQTTDPAGTGQQFRGLFI